MIAELGEDPDVEAYLQRIIPKIQATRDAVKQNNTDAQERDKFYYDWNAQWPVYKVGDEVLLFDPTVRKGVARKLRRQYRGPFVIDQVFPGYTYALRDLTTGKLLPSHIHSNRLRPYYKWKRLLHPTTLSTTTAADDTSPAQQSADDLQTQPTSATQPGQQTTQLPDGWFAIRKLLGKKKMAGQWRYLVLWSDGSKSYEPEDNITEVAIKEYQERVRNQRKARKQRKKGER